MKKVAAFIAGAGYLTLASQALADVKIQVIPPAQGVTAPATTVLTSALTIIFVLAALAVLFMLIIGAFQWIVSGGNKEAVDGARKRITAALIGFALLALAVLIVRIVGQIVNIDVFSFTSIPSLNGN